MMVVLIIVGVLLGISIPAYQGYVQRAYRSDAHSGLLDIASRQERYVAQKNTYTGLISQTTDGLGMGRTTSEEGYYDMSVAACEGGTLAICYVITATAIGGQANDTDCATITYDNTGTKSGTTDDCW